MDNQNNINSGTQQRDEKLWRLAKKRTAFKKSLLIYLAVNVLLWGIWLFTSGKHGNYTFPWPAFVTLGWGIGIAFSYIGAYTGYKESLTEKEYNKLINKN
ncbi:MAG: 2TM domain-containing protein [Ignavibacteria bacterium]|nr:2TM domain-containing protein [Ignavibacteria bacterium]